MPQVAQAGATPTVCARSTTPSSIAGRRSAAAASPRQAAVQLFLDLNDRCGLLKPLLEPSVLRAPALDFIVERVAGLRLAPWRLRRQPGERAPVVRFAPLGDEGGGGA